MANLLKETKDVLKYNGKTFDDVVAIFGDDFKITKENFIKVANRSYDSGFGGQEVAKDLKILGKDFIMKRGEYDGSEWWDYIPFAYEIPKNVIEVKSVITNNISWVTLKEIDEQESEEN